MKQMTTFQFHSTFLSLPVACSNNNQKPQESQRTNQIHDGTGTVVVAHMNTSETESLLALFKTVKLDSLSHQTVCETHARKHAHTHTRTQSKLWMSHSKFLASQTTGSKAASHKSQEGDGHEKGSGRRGKMCIILFWKHKKCTCSADSHSDLEKAFFSLCFKLSHHLKMGHGHENWYEVMPQRTMEVTLSALSIIQTSVLSSIQPKCASYLHYTFNAIYTPKSPF